MSVGLWTIRVLRKIPHTHRFDRHLTDCAYAEILYDHKLTIRQVLGIKPLPPLGWSDECETALPN